MCPVSDRIDHPNEVSCAWRGTNDTEEGMTMPPVSQLEPAARDKVTARLKRIEGQARGIRAMIEDDRDCLEVLDQVASIKAAINGLSAEVAEVFALHCMSHPDQFESPDAAVAHMVRTVIRAGR
jgi:DNA-binding FrmR family transcriptional regulator